MLLNFPNVGRSFSKSDLKFIVESNIMSFVMHTLPYVPMANLAATL